jgi:lipoyl(octanoyl) transferase
MTEIPFIELGTKPYKEIWEYQKNWLKKGLSFKKQGLPIETQILLVEHAHVYTMGKSSNENNLLVNADFLKQIKATAYKTERGGDVTYHGPGQLVAYPLIDLNDLGIGVKAYIYNLEEVVIRLLQSYSIAAWRIEGKTGIWLDKGKPTERKIAAIGIKCSRHLTIHGLAFNINTDLNYFNHIVPCGIANSTVTSLANELGNPIDMNTLIQQFKHHFNLVFYA